MNEEVEGRPGWRFVLEVAHNDGTVTCMVHDPSVAHRKPRFKWDPQSDQTKMEAARAAIDAAISAENNRRAASLAELRAILKPCFLIGTKVALKGSDDPVLVGVVVEPTDTDLASGRELWGTDVEVCVLVEWPTCRNWEYPEDLEELRAHRDH